MKKVFFLIPLFLFLVWNCGQEVKEKEKPGVTVSILPQEYFVRRIVGDHYEINVMIPPGHSPATYEPTPREMKTVSESILYFRIGHIPFEKAWMEKIASLNKKMKIVDTSRGVPLITGTAPHAHSHQEEAAGEHDHAGIDPHIWLSPSAVKVQAKHILDAFMEVEKDPGKQVAYETNYHAFIQDINRLQAENETILKPLKGKKFMVYHPVWSYFAREYGLVQFPIEIEGKSPGAAVMKKIIDTAKRENIRVIFVQQQFDSSSAQAVANEINGKVITMDPLATDWLTNMKKIAHTFKGALKNGVVE
jgi:zinc transport system substrate-binding protein